MAVQLVPLSGDLRGRIAPAAVAYDRTMRLGATGDAGPLSIDPSSTLLALGVVASMVLLFWSTRTMFQRGGVRLTVRSVVWLGLLVTPLAIVHHVVPLPFVDTFWGVTPRGLRPYGPFVNRNDFAGWLIMAIPLTVGYALARTQSRQRASDSVDPGIALDSRVVWLGLAISLMLAGLLFSLSRSGLLGAAAGLAFLAWSARQRLTAARARWSMAAIGAIFAIAVVFADVDALATRLEGSLSEGLEGRASIWRQTLPMVRDFWPVGSGAGTYQAAMIRYQTMSRLFTISHADNEALQIVAEGGVLLAAPLAIALAAGVLLIARRVREDTSAIVWLRLGAVAGMLALATQNMVEMTLRVPANAVLFTILAALAVHEPGK